MGDRVNRHERGRRGVAVSRDGAYTVTYQLSNERGL